MPESEIGFGGVYLNPKWDEADRVHDWRNYISEELRAIWDTFTPEQKRAIAKSADEQASRETWD